MTFSEPKKSCTIKELMIISLALEDLFYLNWNCFPQHYDQSTTSSWVLGSFWQFQITLHHEFKLQNINTITKSQ